ncbi:MAG: sulfurtransferase TusA family protein [Roseobacter sp.]|jgi:tRNA 2-thiouridine synthesizing protein A|nr:sulfurtransferase TusA family protein [Roseobacter sp.]
MKQSAYLTDMTDDAYILDATGLLCPLPVLKARKRLQRLSKGECLTVLADDPAAIVDVPHFCAESGHRLVSSALDGQQQTYVIEKT